MTIMAHPTPSPPILVRPTERGVYSIRKRLESIVSDSSFAICVSAAYGLPLVANERCGSWYIPPGLKVESVYFKSTDGHMDEWSFNLRRINLQLLRVVAERGGAVIVDSTRRKTMPDSLSKTIPIWCCVLNRAIFPDAKSYHQLYTPQHVISPSEHAQIEKRIDTFVCQFVDICQPNLAHLQSQILKPLRPIWVTQASALPEARPQFADFHPLVLCTASRRVNLAESFENEYIQGAADDHEAWSCGLNAQLFWKHKTRLLETKEEDLSALIKNISSEEEGTHAWPTRIAPTSNLFVSATQNLDLEPYDVVVSCGTEPLTANTLDHARHKKYLLLKCQNGKPGSRDLRSQLPHLVTFFSTLPSQTGKILICCSTGKDLSVGVSLAILCLYTDENGKISPKPVGNSIDKAFIKRRLTWLTTTNASLNPSRTTLLSIHAFLMSEPFMIPRNAMPDLQLVGADRKPLITPSNLACDKPSLEATRSSFSTADDLMPAIFNALWNQGKPWRFTRTLTSKLPEHSSGTVNGKATFIPFKPSSCTSPKHTQAPSVSYLPNTLLYSEDGEFATIACLRFETRKSYIYCLSADVADDAPSRIAVYFCSDEDLKQERIGGLFVETDALKMVSTDGQKAILKAKNKEQHICAEDSYTASWGFDTRLTEDDGAGGEWWEVQYIVKGPNKDYTSHTIYRRA